LNNDEKKSPMLSIQDIGNLVGSYGGKFKVTVFDACWMGSDIVVNAMEGNCDYVVASEAVAWTPDISIRYKDFLNSIYGDMTPEEFAQAVVDANGNKQQYVTMAAFYTAENLVNCREEMSTKIESVLAERLVKYNIEVVNTAVEDMDFTDAFTNAVEAKQVAQQNKLKAETVAEQKVVEAEAAAKVKTVEAQAKAEADKIAADAEAYQIEVKATAEAEANKKLSESVTGTLIEYEYAQNWDGKLPTYMSGDSGMIPVIN
jgi:hypothetical protein